MKAHIAKRQSEHKKQHFVAQCYLRAWCDPNAPADQTPYVWLFSKDGARVRHKAPENLFWETDMYTISMGSGSRGLVLEHGLHELEDLFVKVRDERLIPRKPLTPQDRAALCAFIAASHSRTPARRDHLKKQWGQVVQLMDDMMESYKQASPDQRRTMRSISAPANSREEGMTYDNVKRLAEQPLQASLDVMIQVETPLLFKLNLAILSTNSSPGFITSDSPCVWFDPQWYKRPPFYQQPALIYKTTEITFPITPKLMIVLNQQGLDGYAQIKKEGMVDELNRRTRFHAHKHFIVNRNVKKAIWLDPGKPPSAPGKRPGA